MRNRILTMAARHNGAYRRIGEDILAMAAGAGLGAGLMYLYDPNRGRSRRSKLKADAAGLLHRDEHKLEKLGKNLLNRAKGLAAEAAAAVAPEEPVTDDLLVERIRSRMGHIVAHPHEIEVEAKDGVVALKGKLARGEKRRLREEVAHMPGVRRVDDCLSSGLAMSPGVLIGLAAGLAMLRKPKVAA